MNALPPPCRVPASTLLLLAALLLPVLASAEEPSVDHQATEISEPPITPSDRDHWAFHPLVRPPLPNVRDAHDWVQTPVDRFILAPLERRELQPLPIADRETLIRRLSFNLLGLPPALEEIDSFVSDPAPDAYERLVERMLASPRYGERWAQHWLDLARFAETDGFEHDLVRHDAWRYRDWVIDALNRDLPYDRFITLQLAGDEIAPGDESAARATAFCLSGPDMPDVNSQDERRHQLLSELTSTVGSVLLGLQFGCAECHDHRYDPISQADFYRLRAVFAPAVQVKKNKSVDLLSEPGGKPPVSHLLVRGEWQRPGAVVEPAFPRIANSNDVPFVPQTTNGSSGRRAALARWLTRPDHPLTSRVIVNRVWQFHFGEGLSRTPSDFGVMGDEPSHPELLDWLATELVRTDWSLKSLHRLIVTSGVYRQASRPASSQWSADVQQAAIVSHRESLDRNPSNRWLARFPRRRLEGEVIRDAMLAIAGSLDAQQSGPGVMPPLPAELQTTLLKNHWKTSSREADHHRRSVYVFARRNLRYPVFDVFDRPDGNASCAARDRSTTAPQALLMMNSELTNEMAWHLAERVMGEASDTDDRIRFAFRQALARWPTADELRDARGLLDELQRQAKADDVAAGSRPLPDGLQDLDRLAVLAMADLCLALFNSNEFIYID